MAEAGVSPGRSDGVEALDGAKARDYWWTVLAVDPVARPLVRVLAARRWLTPDQATLLSLGLGLPVGVAYATGRAGLVVGALLFYVSFLFDCIDGKLARVYASTSARGKALDEIADGARRASAALGLLVYLWRFGARPSDVLWAGAYGVLSFYFMEISGVARATAPARRGWTRALARRRLLPTPGMPDASAIVYVLGPLVGWVVPALAVGLVLIVAGIVIAVVRRLRMARA